ncbi:MAG: T9SS type A sorting domain-containing protein [Fidelibacterota bacterium]
MKKVKGGVLLLLLSGLAFASQDFLLSPDGRNYPVDSEAKAFPKELTKFAKAAPEVKPQAFLSADDFQLFWPDYGTYYTFGFDTGDSMGLYLEPPAAAIVKKVLFFNTDFTGDIFIGLNDALYNGEVTSSSCVDGGGWVGFWANVVDGDTVQGLMGENTFWLAGDDECWSDPPIGAELWPGLGIGFYKKSIDTMDSTDTWLEQNLAVLGYPDTIDTPFFITFAFAEDFTINPDSWGIGAWGTVVTPYHGFKNYVDPAARGKAGWWLRSFGWDVGALVEYVEDPAPFIVDMTILGTTVSTDPREVSATITDIDPVSGNAGVADALLWYAVNGGTPASVAMTADVDTFAADIPGASPGDVVEYYITATDLAGNVAESPHFTYDIFEPVETSLLINDGDWPDVYIEFYWLYGLLGEWPHDIWNVANIGPAPASLYPNYETIVQLDNDPLYECNAVPDTWLDEGLKNFAVSGDEWMNYCFDGWDPTDFVAGDFPYDYMGVDQTYPDISGGATGVSRLIPVQDDSVSGELFTFLSDSLLLNYDPNYEIGADNWLDGADATADAIVTFWGVSGILDSLAQTDPEADTVASGIRMELANGSKTAYLAFDVLSLNTVAVGVDTLHGAGYHWIGIYPEGPLPQVLEWFDAYVSIDDAVSGLPSRFTLHQNYPNPFNPVTTINFDLPRDGNVTLTVYNMLGQKVTTLVNDFRSAGRHRVIWNGTTDLGTAVATGVYLYRIDAGDYSATKKMVLLK